MYQYTMYFLAEKYALSGAKLISGYVYQIYSPLFTNNIN